MGSQKLPGQKKTDNGKTHRESFWTRTACQQSLLDTGRPGPGEQFQALSLDHNGVHNGGRQQKGTTGRPNGKMMENEKCHVYGG